MIQGTPRSRAEGAQLQEQIKDAFDRPYLPGSSLKGALRTALGWQLWQSMGMKAEARLLNRSARWAAQGLERQIFGESPNTDSLRALQVSDSGAVGPERLMVLNARVLSKSGALASPIELEAVRAETVFEMEAKLDLALFSEWARRQRLQLRGQDALKNLPPVLNARTLQRARQEAAWYKDVPGAKRVLGFYQQLEGIRPEPNQFVLQLGWGTGWDDKTFGSRLREDSAFMERIIADYRLSRGKGRPGGVFPASRRVAMSYRRDAQDNVTESPAYPLGWLLVEFEETGPARGAWSQAAQRQAQAEAAPPTAKAQPKPQEPPAAGGQAAAQTPPPPREPQAVKAAPAQAARPVQPVLNAFTSRPEPGQRFMAEVIDPNSRPVYLVLPGLPDDLWTGTLPEPARRLRDGEQVRCEVVAVREDPAQKGAWLVECRQV